MTCFEELLIQKSLEMGLITEDDLNEVQKEETANFFHSESKWSYCLFRLIQNKKLSEIDIKKLSKEIYSESNLQTEKIISEQKAIEDNEKGGEKVTLNIKTRISNSASLPSSSEFPTSIENYQIEKLLGEGGMGQVYLAYDAMLDRKVALKMLRVRDANLLERFFLEARLQSKVKHDNVCQVYAVSNNPEQPYISMQYIPGKTLRETYSEITLEQKVKILIEIAQAIHAAHRKGLIHRDIKPDNIMVEPSEEGGLKPYILDFGLAREQQAPGITATGVIMGTPHYIAPEQLRGNQKNIDRRTDVYSLGATFYEILTNRTVFDGDSALGIVLKVLHDDPLPIRQIDQSLPEDLEIIIGKCLEKEPQYRYESARALAEDLQKYLDDEPINARRHSTFYWLKKKYSKHKKLVIIMIITFLLLSSMGSYAVYTKIKSRHRLAIIKERAILAQQFGHKIKEIEDIMRFATMMPLHNIKREKKIVRNKMQIIENQANQLGEVGIGPGHYAMGRGYLVLKDYRSAQKYLEQAWAEDYQAPEVASSLGQVLGWLYQQNIQTLVKIKNKKLRKRRSELYEKQYLKPALNYLQQSTPQTVEYAEFNQALIAFYQKKYSKALKLLHEAIQLYPWLYEANQLEGDILLLKGNQEWMLGNLDDSIKDFKNAILTYEKAMTLGRSDWTVYQRLATAYLLLLKDKRINKTDFIQLFDSGIKACNNAQKIDPNQASSYRIMSALYIKKGRFQIKSGEKISETLQIAEKFSRKSIELNPKNFTAYNYLGTSIMLQAKNAIAHGKNATAAMQQAKDAFESALKLAPADTLTLYNLGLVFYYKAKINVWLNENCKLNIKKAIQFFLKAYKLNEFNISPVIYSARANLLLAKWSLNNNFNPADYLNETENIIDKIEKKQKGMLDTKLIIGEFKLIEGQFLIKRGQNPKAVFQAARSKFQDILDFNPASLEAIIDLEKLYRWQAAWEITQKKSPADSVRSGLQVFSRAMKLNSLSAEAHALKGVLLLLKSLHNNREKNHRKTLKQAEASLQYAFSLNPLYKNEYEPFLIRVKYQLKR